MKTITYFRNGATRTIPVGFSWTTFIFGPWPSAVRGHWSFFFLMLLVDFFIVPALIAAGAPGIIIAIALQAACAMFRNDELNKAYIDDGWKSSMATRNAHGDK